MENILCLSILVSQARFSEYIPTYLLMSSYLKIVKTKLFPASLIASWASLCLSRDISCPFTAEITSPACNPAASPSDLKLTWKKWRENSNTYVCMYRNRYTRSSLFLQFGILPNFIVWGEFPRIQGTQYYLVIE